VGKGLTIKNGTNSAGSDATTLWNLNVGGALTIANGDGNTVTTVRRNAVGTSAVRGSVSVTNGTGSDFTNLEDTNVGGSVTVRNGHGSSVGSASTTQIFNRVNPFRSVVRGNVSFSDLDGDGVEGLWDVDVGGNVTLAHGSGTFNTYFDGVSSQLPALVHGNVTISGTGADLLNVGANNTHTGLIVGRNLTVASGAGDDSLTVNRLQVGGATQLSLGDGTNTVNIDDSLFAGTFTLTTGAGADALNLDTLAGTTAETAFEKAFLVRQGGGFNAVTLGGGTDNQQTVVFDSTAVIHHGSSAVSLTRFPAVYFPFGTSLQWIV